MRKKEVKNQWTQKVFKLTMVRYQGSATWVRIDGKSYWKILNALFE